MIVDTSAVVALLAGEREAIEIARALHRARHRRISATTLVELAMVASDARIPISDADIDELLVTAGIEVVPFTSAHATIARGAHLRFGRGSRSKAKLNYGDCLVYATATSYGEPLLYVGKDFASTDVVSALG